MKKKDEFRILSLKTPVWWWSRNNLLTHLLEIERWKKGNKTNAMKMKIKIKKYIFLDECYFLYLELSKKSMDVKRNHLWLEATWPNFYLNFKQKFSVEYRIILNAKFPTLNSQFSVSVSHSVRKYKMVKCIKSTCFWMVFIVFVVCWFSSFRFFTIFHFCL